VLHYGLFTLVHGIFAVVIGLLFAPPGAAEAGPDWLSFAGAALALSVIHLGDYLRWRETRGWEARSADAQMFAPYGRIIVMHLTVLVGAFILIQTKAPVAYIALLAVLKTFIETGWALIGDRQLAGGKPRSRE
jgi:cation transporter-like permease